MAKQAKSFRLDAEVWDRLKQKSDEKGVPLTVSLESAILHYVGSTEESSDSDLLKAKLEQAEKTLERERDTVVRLLDQNAKLTDSVTQLTEAMKAAQVVQASMAAKPSLIERFRLLLAPKN